MMFVVFFVLFAKLNSCFMVKEVPIVKTTHGQVRGVYEKDDDGEYFMYMGIPYARPPPDNNFGPPIDAEPWSDILEANKDDVRCPQLKYPESVIDCLRLNVYVPANRTSNSPLATLVWLHGGKFFFGSSSREMWGPEKLVRHGIILITVNFRLGPYGFNCLGIKKAPGNTGFRDIIYALRWIQNNIAAFGGNPNQVTLGGHSAGATSTETLMASPMSKGLFQSVILLSGSVLSVSHKRNLNNYSHYQNRVIAKFLGFESESAEDILDFLNKQVVRNVVNASETNQQYYSVCAEHIIPGVEPFLTEMPSTKIERGDYEPVDMLMGHTEFETPIAHLSQSLNESFAKWFYDILDGFHFKDNKERLEVADIVRRFYIGNEYITNAARWNMTFALSDAEHIYSQYRSLQLNKKKGSTIYYYVYAYNGARDFFKATEKATFVFGAHHGNELPYLFNQQMWKSPLNGTDALVSHRLTLMWTNFVKYRDPTYQLNNLIPVRWLPVEPKRNFYLRIGKDLTLEWDFELHRMAFWDLMYKNFYRIQQNTDPEYFNSQYSSHIKEEF